VHLSEIAAQRGEDPALVMVGPGISDPPPRRSFDELDRRSRQVAALLDARGHEVGDHVALLMGNSPEYVEVALGAQRAGQFFTPVNWHLTEEEAAYVVADCGARTLFASPDTRDLALRVTAATPGVELVLVPDAATGDERVADLVATLDAQSAATRSDEREGVYFFYSSGTTGRPKGIRPHHDFPPFGTGLPLDRALGPSFGLGAGSVYLCPAPLYHSAPTGWTLGTIRNAATAVVMDRFDPLECLRAIETHRVTHAQFVPTHFVRMLKLPREQRESFDLSSLEVVVHAAAPCPVEVKRAMIDWIGPKIMEYYAGSEGNGMTVIDSASWLAHPGSVGRAVIGTVHVVGEDGSELPPGEVGTVYFSDGGTFEYHDDPEKTVGAFDARGWSTLGDLGHVDDDGYLYLDDRRTDLIISGGVNIYPAEIEDALILHPDVADVAIIGVPDDEMGQAVLAVVQPTSGVTTDPEALRAHARERLAGFKVPRRIELVAELPRLPTGKLLRRRLRDQFVPTPAPGDRTGGGTA
jgi:acyl-CoA synthetase (AMP-forming)/AMP-acid ligase II